MIRLAVFGFPIAHSLSPSIHLSFAAQKGLDVEYRAIEATPQDFHRKLAELAGSGGRGCNVTVPLKNDAWKLAARSSDSARLAEAANTLRFDTENDWYADNTDGRGLARDLEINLRQPLADSRILILGAGGASAGILNDLLVRQPESVVIANRNPERATRLARRVSDRIIVEAVSLHVLEILEPFDLVINATSAGHEGSHPALIQTLFRPNGLCYDLNYGLVAKPLRDHCRELGIDYHDGLGMLVEQAALSFKLWTGAMPETGPVLEELRASL